MGTTDQHDYGENHSQAMSYYPDLSTYSVLDDRGPHTRASDKLGKPLLYIVRHANVAEDSKGLIRGLLNPELDAKGERGAKAVAEFFKDIDISAIYVDDLKRTIQTAEPLAEEKQLAIEIDPDLRSWDVGTELEGEPIEDHEDDIAEFRKNPDDVPVGGQSWGEYREQIISALHRYTSIAMDNPSPIVVITHGSAIQVIWEAVGDLENPEKYDDIPLEPAGIAAFYLTRMGARVKILEGAGDNLDE